LERLADLLRQAGLEPTAEDIADVLWLAARLPAVESQARALERKAAANIAPVLLAPPLRQPLPSDRKETFGDSEARATVSTESRRGSQTADLYPAQAIGATGVVAAQRIRSPGAAALPGALELGRSLRPLKRRVASRTRVVLDEGATAQQIAETRVWSPVLRPAPERWLDVLLLVDESSSMLIWQRTVAELRSLLERQGAFRNVEMLGFRSRPDDSGIQIYPGIGPRADRERDVRRAALVDPSGRRLIAVVSDCVSRIWHNGVMAGLLAEWGGKGLAVIAQVLPERLWPRTGLRSYPGIFMRSPSAGAANSEFEIEWSSYRPREEDRRRGVAVPVVSLEAPPLAYWARMLAGNSNLWIGGVQAIPLAVPVADPAPTRAEAAQPDRLVRLFYGTASPTARDLASRLAAVPLTLPVMRLVQRALLPQSRQVHLAEVWLSGLIDRPREIDYKTQADDVEYSFVSGVRELLLNSLRAGEAVSVLKEVSKFVGDRLGQALDFGALLANPHAEGELKIAGGYEPFARIAATTLRRFGGRYGELARRLETTVLGTAPTVATTATIPGAARIKTQRARKETVTVRALLVATNEHGTSGLAPLRGALNDARITEEWLRKRFHLPAANVRMLLGSAATKKAIVAAWRDMTSRMEEGDQFLFHFSGYDQQIATSDPDEPDGLEETLVVYDSIPGQRTTLLTHTELADLASEVEQRGGQSILLLDSCRMASAIFARRSFNNTLVFAASAEAEIAVETVVEGNAYGAVSYYLAEAMREGTPGRTWFDVYEQVVARIRLAGLKQTPQLIGPAGMVVFEDDRKPLPPPHLLVIRWDEREIEVQAPASLGLTEGAMLAILPPGGATNLEIGRARVIRRTANGVAASRQEGPDKVPVATRAVIADFGREKPLVRVALSSDMFGQVAPSSLVDLRGPDFGETDLRVTGEGNVHAIVDRNERVAWREVLDRPVVNSDLPLEAVTSIDTSLEVRAGRIRQALEQIARFLRTSQLRNLDPESMLSGKVEMEVLGAAGGTVTLEAAETLRLRVRNRADKGVYISVWMLDDHLGVKRIFPSNAACVMLGREKSIDLAVDVPPGQAASMRISFKVFASEAPDDLSILSMQPLDQPVDLSALQKIVAPPFRGEESRRASWVPGGPVASTAKLWPNGSTLRIRFLDGDLKVRSRVEEAAMEWTTYANLQFKFVRSGKTELRISFAMEGGAWSYCGTDARSIPQNRPTINLGNLNRSTSDEEVKRTVLRDFGFALGLLRSHQSPVAKIPWNEKAAYRIYEKEGWSRDAVDTMILRKHSPDQVRHGPPDPDSIMYSPIPKEATDGKLEIVPGDKLSNGDKLFIAELYPRSSKAS
jgi:hypothetical protein